MSALPIETIAQSGIMFDPIMDTPWESIGRVIPEGATAKQALRAAGLDWTVQRGGLMATVTVDDPENPGDTKDEIIPVPDAFALVRSDNQSVLSVVGKRYKPVQNEDAFQVFHEFVQAGNMKMETAGSLSSGQHIWGLAAIDSEFELCSGELIKGYFLLVQSHKYGHALRAMFTPVRFPGGHTFVQSIRKLGRSGSYAMPHSREFNEARIQEIKNVLGIAQDSMQTFYTQATRLSKTRMDEAAGVEFLTRVFQPKLIAQYKLDGKELPESLDALTANEDASRVLRQVARLTQDYPGADLPSCNGTAWGYYNTVAHAVDKVMGHGVNTRLESAWFGLNAQKKQQAMTIAQEYTKG